MCYRLSHHATAPSGAIHCGTGGCGRASSFHWGGVMITPIIPPRPTLPDGTVAHAEGAGDLAALAVWWAGCFPERVTRRAAGRGMLRAYVTFAAQALALAARIPAPRGPVSSLCARAAEEAEALHAALAEARRDYLGRDAHSAGSRLERFLSRLGPGPPTPPTLN